MSRAYRIQVKESHRRHVELEDGVCSRLELLPVLERDRLAELLGAELTGRGFTREGNTAVRRQADGVEVTVDLQTGDVAARLSAQKEIAVSATRTARADPLLTDAGVQQLRDTVQAQLVAKADADEQKLRQKLTAQLEDALKGIRAELDQVVNKVTAEALKVRAGELGTIEEISEDPQTGSMTIKVRV